LKEESIVESLITINIGQVSITMSPADAASAAAQIASGLEAYPTGQERFRRIKDNDEMWAHHDGGSRHREPDWTADDMPLARTQDRLPPLTAIFHAALVDHPGQILSVEDLAAVTDGKLANSRVIAGAISGYVKWCERLDRRFPFYWWEGRNGRSAEYAMQQRVADLFQAARGER
jgi:hypothetical protein